LLHRLSGHWLAPPTAQKRICFRRIDVKLVPVVTQKIDSALPGGPVPWFAEETFDHPNIDIGFQEDPRILFVSKEQFTSNHSPCRQG